MISLVRLYSDNLDLFPEIKFNDGLNVIFASVSDNSRASSHSLGKTTLVDVIDYLFLKTIDKNSLLKNERLSSLSLLLEIKVSGNEYVTVKRKLSGKVDINVSRNSELLLEQCFSWTYTGLSFKSAKEILNGLICPSIVRDEGFNFRNGLRYCLRKQTNYEEAFKVKSGQEPPSGWVPYLGSVLGINSKTINEKFECNKRVEALSNAIKQLKDLPKESGRALEAEVIRLNSALDKMKRRADNFDFRRTDEIVSKELINEVNVNVASLTKELYSIDNKLGAINSTLNSQFNFDLSRTISVYEDVRIHFPREIIKGCEELIELNREMTEGRKFRLNNSKKALSLRREEVSTQLKEASEKQRNLAKILVEKDTFEKYKSLQRKITLEEVKIATLKEKLKQLDLSGSLEVKLDEAKDRKKEAGRKLEPETNLESNIKLRKAVELFGEITDDILDFDAFFYAETNKEGNLNFQIKLKNQTSINQGFSYTRVLSAIFDLTLLLLHKDEDFYRFCYHDGLLESLDDRIKIRLIEYWRNIAKDNGFQLILSVLDSDLPLGTNGDKIYFSPSEVVRELHDRGDAGRLFRMPAF